jgi:hypothetical protein
MTNATVPGQRGRSVQSGAGNDRGASKGAAATTTLSYLYAGIAALVARHRDRPRHEGQEFVEPSTQGRREEGDADPVQAPPPVAPCPRPNPEGADRVAVA